MAKKIKKKSAKKTGKAKTPKKKTASTSAKPKEPRASARAAAGSSRGTRSAKKKPSRNGAKTDGVRTNESIEQRSKRAGEIIKRLKKLYPKADCALEHDSALQLLISTILSAQSTDETVNRVTPDLFRKYKNAAAFAKADAATLEAELKPTGFFRQKTKSVQGACRRIVDEFGGDVPATMDELVTLPGVARKTANVVLGTWFGKNEGFVVDTHIGRLAQRMALTWTAKDSKDAVKIEHDLMQIIPQGEWTWLGHALIWHGRRVCNARKPNCAECVVSGQCPSAFTFDGK